MGSPARGPAGRRWGPLRFAVRLLGGLFVLSLVVMAVPPAWMGMAQMPPDALRARLIHRDANLAVVDVRTGYEFTGGHIPGAVSVPLHRLPVSLESLAPYRGHEVVLVCLTGHRSRLAGLVLRLAGFRRVTNLDGGMTAWRAAGYREAAGPAP